MPTVLKRAGLVLALTLTAGCVAGQPVIEVQHPQADGMPFHQATPDEMAERCGAAGLQHLVGQSWPQTLPPRHADARVYRTGDPLTMDHRPDRLNIEIARNGRRVVAVSCG
jgi:hypothetical protein